MSAMPALMAKRCTGGRLPSRAVARMGKRGRGRWRPGVVALAARDLRRQRGRVGRRVGQSAARTHLSGMTVLDVDRTSTLGTVVARAAAGDEEAFAAIVGAYQQDMVRVAFGICGEAELARDAVQSALVVAWRKLGTVREPDHVRSWLIAVAANEARQLVRRRRPVRLEELAMEPSADGDAESAGAISRVDLANALRRLSAEERTVIALRYGAGLDSEEIGRIVGVSASGVRSRLARLMDRLRKDLGDA